MQFTFMYSIDQSKAGMGVSQLFDKYKGFSNFVRVYYNNNVLLNQDNYTIISYMGKGPRLRGTKQEPWQGIH